MTGRKIPDLPTCCNVLTLIYCNDSANTMSKYYSNIFEANVFRKFDFITTLSYSIRPIHCTRLASWWSSWLQVMFIDYTKCTVFLLENYFYYTKQCCINAVFTQDAPTTYFYNEVLCILISTIIFFSKSPQYAARIESYTRVEIVDINKDKGGFENSKHKLIYCEKPFFYMVIIYSLIYICTILNWSKIISLLHFLC